MLTQTYTITGMTCAACSSAVERVTRKMDGVEESNVNLTTGLLTITYDETKLTPEEIIKKVDRAGFGAELHIEKNKEEQREAAALFNTNLPKLETLQEREKAFRDILLAAKKNSYEYYMGQMGSDMTALTQAIEGKKALEELAKTHISLE